MKVTSARAPRWLALLVTVLATGIPAAVQADLPGQPARGGEGLLEAMQGNALAVVGRIDEVRPVDARGYRARIWVERVLGARAGDYDEGTPLRIAWEELAAGRPPRFGESERALIVLERLSTASIWRTRIPDATQRRQTLGVANDGAAFLNDPGLGTLDLLHHYLSIAPDDRSGAAGARYLASLAAEARLPLAIDAARQLARTQSPGEALGAKGEEALVRALLREDAEPHLARALLPAIEATGTSSLQKRLRNATADRDDAAPPAPLFAALAVVHDDGLSASELRWLQGRDDAQYREIAARGSTDSSALRQLAGKDPSPAVRGVALERLVGEAGPDAQPDVLSALADAAPEVRAIAAQLAASFGDTAVPALRAIAYGRYDACCAESIDAQRAAVAGLSLAGSSGRLALAEVAADHPDPSLRKLAALALGELRTHEH